MTADAGRWRRESFVSELEVLAWIGPADAATIAAQHEIRSEEETAARLEAAAGLSLVRIREDGRYALTDDGYSELREAIDGHT